MSFRKIRRNYWLARRLLLKVFVPEFVWPKEVIIGGAPIKVRDTPYTFGTKLSLVKGNYELEEIKLLDNALKANDNVIEMGGSIGVLTRVISAKLPEGKIISIEASEKLTAYSKDLLEKNTNTTVINGFGFPVKRLNFNLKVTSFDEHGGSLGGKLQYERVGEKRNSSSAGDRIFDLERIVSEYQIEPSALVIDIEGSEKIILDISPCFFKTIRVILIELHPNLYGIDTAKLIVSKIEDEGFVLEIELDNVYLFNRLD